MKRETNCRVSCPAALCSFLCIHDLPPAALLMSDLDITHAVIEPAQSRAPLITCPRLRSSFIWLLLVFSSFSLQAHLMPQATCHRQPPPQLPIPKLILLNKALEGGSFSHLWRQGLCQGTCTCQWKDDSKEREKGREGKGGRREGGREERGCTVPILCLHTEGYWV